MATPSVTRSFLLRTHANGKTIYFWESFKAHNPSACAFRARALYPRGQFQICDIRPVVLASSIAGDVYTSLSQALTSFRGGN